MMSTTERDDSARSPRLEGRVRVDEQTRRLASRLEPGDIAVIDHPDIDRSTAQALIAAQPLAVLNAAPSQTGRHKVLGPDMLVDAGILLFDDLGEDVMTLREGDIIEIIDGTIRRGDDVIADARPFAAELRSESVEAESVRTQVVSFAAAIEEFLKTEGDVLVRGRGIPQVTPSIDDKIVLLVMDSEDSAAQLKRLKRWIRDTHPVVIGVDSGADVARAAHLKPEIIVGNMDVVSEKSLRSGAQLVVPQKRDGTAPGKERLDRMGIDYSTIEMSGNGEDVATVIAAHSRVSSIVTVGAHHTLDDFVDQGRGAMAPSFFARLLGADLLISAESVAATHRPRISSGLVVLLACVVLATCGVAFWSTPLGHDAFTVFTSFFADLLNLSSSSSGGAAG
ncbi:putative cytokinetic ring protein SteA [Schaalia sp. ZJ1691]|uniref:putative cytokinetic ring protein SteA n=1 Tax=Schaalia sp. ZJ1691 TaxID=2709404 RepID=UPI0013EB8D58|nr:putative cytokinetic ring protein SteA [Schaalia sp. ZJ1691]